jgi:glycosyltransferase involved in cell wall biosynthesis
MEGVHGQNRLITSRPTVSVLMTVYNGERYLAEAVESILAQTFDDFEFIIVDDGSTDSSLVLLRAFERRDPRIRLFERPHAGIVPAANFGLRQCRGEFIARMDSDDVALPHRFELQVRTLREHPEVVVIGGAYDLIDAAGRFLRRQWPPTDDPSLQELSLSGLTPICQPLAMMRKAAVDQVGEYDRVVETAEDNDMWLRLGEVGKLMCVTEVLLKYRQHANSVSEVKALAQAERIRIGCEKAYMRRHVHRTFRPPPAWRPSGEQSRYLFLCQYGWWAFRHAQRSTAIIYGLKAVQKQPLNRKGWSLLMTSLLKPMPIPPDRPGAAGHSGLAA